VSEQDPAHAHPVPTVRGRSVQLFIAALAALLPLHLLVLVLRGSAFSGFDYFEMVPQVVAADGSVIWSGLFTHQNDHLVALPKVIYLANIWLFSGSNVSLGVVVWLLAVLVGVALVWGMRHQLPTSGWNFVIVCWLLAVYLFPLQGQHNFRLAMSGASWILANVFAVAAVALLVHGRPVLAGVSGALATISYGTGLAVWPALAVIAVVRRRFGKGEIAMVALGAASVGLQRLTADSDRAAFYNWNVLEIGRSMTVTVGGLVTDEADVASLVGLAAMIAAATAIIRLGSRLADPAPLVLIGVITYTMTGLALFGISRGIFGDDAFLASRYMTFAALFVLAASLLVLSIDHRSDLARGLIVVMALGSVLASGATTDRLDGRQLRADVHMVAAYMGAGVGVIPLYSDATDAAFRASGHIPFHGGFAADCGRFGQQLDPGAIGISDDVTGRAATLRLPGTDDPILAPAAVDVVPAFEISGWLDAPEDVECVLIVDDDAVVVGIAILGRPRLEATGPDATLRAVTGWDGYVLQGSNPGRALVKLRDDDRFFVIDRVPDL